MHHGEEISLPCPGIAFFRLFTGHFLLLLTIPIVRNILIIKRNKKLYSGTHRETKGFICCILSLEVVAENNPTQYYKMITKAKCVYKNGGKNVDNYTA
jgi:hypothetical protein